MTDLNDLMPTQKKLEWVTPKISLMGVDDTFGKISVPNESKTPQGATNVLLGNS
jgi:hypothetical protein